MNIKSLLAVNVGLTILRLSMFGQIENAWDNVKYEHVTSVNVSQILEDTKVAAEQKQLLSEAHTLITIELVEKNKYLDEAYFHDSTSQYPNIYVSIATMEWWGVKDMELGDTVTAIFDEDGWELNGFIKGSVIDAN